MNKSEKSKIVYESLLQLHPNAHCELDYTTPYELLIAIILSAQCTDKRVNEVTKKLFAVVNTPEKMAEIPIEQLEKLIFSCGFYHNKAKNIIDCSKQILMECNGVVPDSVDELVKLAGVGRKTANVLVSEVYGKSAIAVDTHVGRVSRRLGFSKSENPDVVEQDLMKAFPQEKWSKLHHLFIFQGRYICHSKKPNCAECTLHNICKYYSQMEEK